ncbi:MULTISPECIES: Dyp-type peroxidase [Pseudomonas]|jgi:porphyrinogen peroxidase|uniref:Dyp-type peroxidase n=1 Tax=Pseudomonas rhodesiae TaxID=76760 RepID=A0A8I1JF17_9PSED|nr:MULTISPECIES: Dyp-type peroxidase [Pseudomonas]MBB4814576.1 putative iron-dependent peroxidase [Pseudomonas rhodesiae]MBI6600871.1 Dyp-type peroxidase [Pseudomonas sp. S4_EA_1b]MBI6625624.1 Dyp-type peroxidase [Pseudomonas rhodesiae]MBX4134423.1 Dyp-type peroxidase [Pseudomonas sp. S5F11]NMY81127.1 Dyp-type peroxidase [Pseudomonas rhodesiae]
MSQYQSGILAAPVPLQARHLFFAVDSLAAVPVALDALVRMADAAAVVGLGEPLVTALGVTIDGLRPFPTISAPGVHNPSTQQALWVWLHGVDRGELLLRSRAFEKALAPGFRLVQSIEGFRYKTGFDLTDYEDGTENPHDDAAVDAALTDGGASFAALQQWQHDLDGFAALPAQERDHIIGRRHGDNEELEDAPESAHTKRTAQESFTPEAFVVRRSMPWAENGQAGLMFLAFGHSFDAFEAQLRRMSGLEDGIVDGLYRISTPLTGGYYWCPPVLNGHLDFSALAV